MMQPVLLAFFFAISGVLAEDPCATTLDGVCGTEEGLELLQSRGVKITAEAKKEDAAEMTEEDKVDEEEEAELELLQDTKQDSEEEAEEEAEEEDAEEDEETEDDEETEEDEDTEEDSEEDSEEDEDTEEDSEEDSEEDDEEDEDTEEDSEEDSEDDTEDDAEEDAEEEAKSLAISKKDTKKDTTEEKKSTPEQGKKFAKQEQAEKSQKVLNVSSKTNSSKGAKWREIEFEQDALEESDIEKIRFRARHDDWIDILDIYNDGFFKRYHQHDVGSWHVSKGQELVLKWLDWGSQGEPLKSPDGGKTFNTTAKFNFTLKSYKQPVWWRKHFDGSDVAQLQEHSSKAEETSGMNLKDLVRTHMNGRKADLDEAGYRAVTYLNDDDEMERYIRRVVHSLGMEVVNEGGLNGMVPFYSGNKTWQTLKKMKKELEENARAKNGTRWVMDQGGQFPKDTEDSDMALLQASTEKVTPHGDKHTDKHDDKHIAKQEEKANTKSSKTSQEKTNTTSSKTSNISALSHHDEKELEIDFEKDLLAESDIEKVRFRARHQDWIDILDLYKDGFFEKYHNHAAGIWRMNKKNQLVLRWFKWGDEEMVTPDSGKSFNSSGNASFTLKSYKQPIWWRKHFEGSDDAHFQEQEKQLEQMEDRLKSGSNSTKAHLTSTDKAIIRAHQNGRKAHLDENGYEAVVMLEDEDEMAAYIHRVAERLNLTIVNEGGLMGMVPYYSGNKTWQSLKRMKAELQETAHAKLGVKKGVRWVMDKDGEFPEDKEE